MVLGLYIPQSLGFYGLLKIRLNLNSFSENSAAFNSPAPVTGCTEIDENLLIVLSFGTLKYIPQYSGQE